MNVEIQSIIFVQATVFLLAFALCQVTRRRDEREPSRLWLSASNLAFLAAAGGLLLRQPLSFELSAVTVIAGAYVGIACGYIGVLRALGSTPPYRLVGGIGAAAIGAQGMLATIADSVIPLMITASLINATVAAAMAMSVWSRAAGLGVRLGALLSLPFGAVALCYAGRPIALAIDPVPAMAAISTVLIVMALAVAAVSWAFGVVAAHEALASRDLARARDAALAADMAKSDMLRAVSHEIRTPLNAIIGLADLMRAELAGPMPETYRGHSERILHSGTYLLDLANDLLDLSAIEAEQLDLAETLFDPATLIADVRALLGAEAAGVGIVIRTTLPAHPPALYADARRIKQVLINLVGNALKYAPASPEVEIELSEPCGSTGGLAICVRDRGPGMTEDEIERAMTLFGRVHRGDGVQPGGAGVGLPLARQLLEAHGATLSLISAPGDGTVAMALFPADRTRPAPCAVHLAASQAGDAPAGIGHDHRSRV